jgi:hypothetical protein
MRTNKLLSGRSPKLAAFLARNRPLDGFVAYGQRSSPYSRNP